LSLFVDTSVWSLAFRRDTPAALPEVEALSRALGGGDIVLSTGIVLQELLQGFAGPKARDAILQRFSALPLLVPERHDHVEAAELRNVCRRAGIQVGTIDALLAQLCIRRGVTMLTTDRDFQRELYT
jgi:predicted nucleic acid-binding protein